MCIRDRNQMGLAYDNAGDLAKARDYYHQCLEVARNIEKDHYFASIALNNIGEGLTDEGDYRAVVSNGFGTAPSSNEVGCSGPGSSSGMKPDDSF